MADLTFTADVSSIIKAQKAVKVLQGNITSLVSGFDKGNISAVQYSKGLLEVKRALQTYSKSSKKATSDVQAYAAAQKKAADQKTFFAAQRKRITLINNSRKIEERAAKASVAETQRVQKEYDKYRASIDDVFAAQQKYNALVQTITTRNKALGVSTQQTAREVEELRQKFVAVGVEVTKTGKVLSAQNRNFSQFGAVTAKGGKSMSRFNMVMQQGGFQLQDFIVQLQGGTSIFTAFSQQGSQFAGIFGPTGAIAGAVIALGSALGGMIVGLRNSGNSAEEAEKRLDALTTSIEDYRSTIERVSGGQAKLNEEFGRFSAFASTALDAMRTVAETKMNAELDNLTNSITQLGNVTSTIPGFIMTAQRDFLEFRGGIMSTKLAVEEFVNAQLQLRDAEGISRQLDAAGNLLNIFSQYAGEYDTLNEEQRIYHDSLVATVLSLSELAKVQDDVASSYEDILGSAEGLATQNEALNDLFQESVKEFDVFLKQVDEAEGIMETLAGIDITSGINSAAIAASDLSDEMKAALQAALGLVQLAKGGGVRGDPRDFTNLDEFRKQLADQEAFAKRMAAKRDRAAKKGRKKSGGGSKADPVADMKENIAQREVLLGLLGEEKTLQEEIFAVEDKLGKDRNKYSDDFIKGLAQQRIALAALEQQQKEALKQQEALANSIAGSFGDAFMSVVDGTKTVGDAFRDMAKSIIKQLFEVLVVQRLVGSFNASTGSGSGLAGLIGPALGGFFADGAAFNNGSVQAFANGGVVDSPTFFGMSGGQAGVMGEAGTEAIMPLKRGPDGKLGVQASGGGQRPINITMNISTPDVKGFEKSRTQIASGLQQSLSQAGRNS